MEMRDDTSATDIDDFIAGTVTCIPFPFIDGRHVHIFKYAVEENAVTFDIRYARAHESVQAQQAEVHHQDALAGKNCQSAFTPTNDSV
jgi:hypothetical protein